MEIQRLLTIGGKERAPGGNLIEVGDITKNAIDLGLDVMWSECNYGSDTMLNTGSYFAWGELSTKARYRSEDYSDIKMDVLDDIHDVVTVNWGQPWRMPTQTEIEELVNECEKEWKEIDGIQGILFKRNGNSVFFPVSGYMEDRDLKEPSSVWIWTKTQTQEDKDKAKSLKVCIDSSIDSNIDSSINNQSKYLGLNVRPVYPISIVVTPHTLEMTVGESKTIRCYIYPEYASDKDVKWEASLSGIVQFLGTNNECIVTAQKKGNVKITAKSDAYSKSDSCVITVTAAPSPYIPVTKITIVPSQKIMNVGKGENFAVIITPSEATNQDVIWASTNTKVASVDENGYVKALSDGVAFIQVTSRDTGISDRCYLEVIAIPVTGISVSPSEMSLTVREYGTISAEITPSDATNKNVSWTSSDTSVATVDSDGNVTPLSAGEAQIIATTEDGRYSASCQVTVTEAS